MRKLFFAVLIAVATGTAAAQAQELAPEKIPGVTTVDVKAAKALYDKGVAFVDTRSTADWDAGRIAGAVHIDSQKMTEAELLKVVKKDQPVVFYCNGVKCLRSPDAAKAAVAWGYTQIQYLRDGLPAWKAANYLVE